jgi:hypothetical protein
MSTTKTPDLRILSIIPPMTQLNTPYPSTAYITGFLRSRGFQADQMDLSIGLALKLLSAEGLQAIHEQVRALPRKRHTPGTRFFADESSGFSRGATRASHTGSLRDASCPRGRVSPRSISTSTTRRKAAAMRSTGRSAHSDCRIGPSTSPPCI